MAKIDAVSERSFVPMTDDDLRRARDVALAVLSEKFTRLSAGATGAFKNALEILCLCQGSALHRLSGTRGIKDIDVWGFFRPVPGKRFPARAVWRGDFGASAHGRHPDDVKAGRSGRRVDVLGRDIPMNLDEDPRQAVRRYLEKCKNPTPVELARRPVVVLWPNKWFGETIWSLTDVATKKPLHAIQTRLSGQKRRN